MLGVSLETISLFFVTDQSKKIMSHKEKKALKKQKKMDEEMEKITKKGGQVSWLHNFRRQNFWGSRPI
jgi:hypothetical protein